MSSCYCEHSALWLDSNRFVTLPWIIPNILPPGATLFTGRGKDGKSLLAWNLCLAVATGGKALGQYDVPEGEALYLCLEDGERRAKKRLMDQMAYMDMEEVPTKLDLVLWESPKVGEGFEEALTTWLDEHPQARLVIVDILERVRPRRTRNGSVYADDYAALAPLQRIAQERNIGVLIIHHSNKTRPEDFRDTANGSMGLIGACDTFWSLQRIAGKADAVLHIIGRDVDAAELALRFADGFWSVLGNAADYRRSKESQEIIDALTTAGKPQTPKELARLLNIPVGTMRVRLKRMLDRSEVLNHGDGYIPRPYSSPPLFHEREKQGVTPVMGVTPVTQDGDERETAASVTGHEEGCNAPVTPEILLNHEKVNRLESRRYSVTEIGAQMTANGN
jgi:hypothetical protein